MPTHWLKIREHTHRRRHHHLRRRHINTMEIINELIQVDRQVAAAAAAVVVAVVRAAIQVATTQTITIEPIEIVKNALYATAQSHHKDFIRCLIVNIMRAVHVWKAI